MSQEKLSKRTINLLRLTRASILAEPCAYNQGHWGPEGKPKCGSAACIIGWMVFHATKWMPKARRKSVVKLYRNDAYRCGASGHFNSAATETLLGLTEEKINRLYWKERWPTQFTKGGGDDAKNAGKRITHFIKTNGAE